jgi:hypothetical protein
MGKREQPEKVRTSTEATADPVGLAFVCPRCMEVCSIMFQKVGEHAIWSWNGNLEKPTCTPSILHNAGKGGCGWHVYLVDGIFKET